MPGGNHAPRPGEAAAIRTRTTLPRALPDSLVSESPSGPEFRHKTRAPYLPILPESLFARGLVPGLACRVTPYVSRPYVHYVPIHACQMYAVFEQMRANSIGVVIYKDMGIWSTLMAGDDINKAARQYAVKKTNLNIVLWLLTFLIMLICITGFRYVGHFLKISPLLSMLAGAVIGGLIFVYLQVLFRKYYIKRYLSENNVGAN